MIWGNRTGRRVPILVNVSKSESAVVEVRQLGYHRYYTH